MTPSGPPQFGPPGGAGGYGPAGAYGPSTAYTAPPAGYVPPGQPGANNPPGYTGVPAYSTSPAGGAAYSPGYGGGIPGYSTPAGGYAAPPPPAYGYPNPGGPSYGSPVYGAPGGSPGYANPGYGIPPGLPGLPPAAVTSPGSSITPGLGGTSPVQGVPLTLYDICAKMLLYLTTFNRRTRQGENPDLPTVRNEIDAIFAEQAALAQQQPHLLPSYQLVEYPLIVTADELLINSRWAFADRWEDGENLIENRRFATRVGGAEFFERLRRVPETRPDVLEIFYCCLCVGFRGLLRHDREAFHRELTTLYLRLPHKIIRDERTLFPNAYEHTNTNDLTRPAALSLLRLVIVALGFVVLFFLGGRVAWDQAVADVLALAGEVAAQWSADGPSKP